MAWTGIAVASPKESRQAAVTLLVSPTVLSFTYDPSQTSLPAAQSVTVSGGSAVFPFTAVAAVATPSGGGWLSVSPNGGSTPLGLRVSVNPAGLPIGSYTGAVTVAAPSAANGAITVTVALTVRAPAVSLTVSPAALAFVYTVGSTLPANQSLTVSSSGSFLSFTASVRAGATPSAATGGTWLRVTPATSLSFAAFPSTLTASVNPADLYPGLYQGTITITSSAAAVATQIFPVTLTITAGTPVLSTLWPVDLPQGGGATTITLTGSALYSGSVVKANNGVADTILAATLLSPTLMTATIPATLMAAAGTLAVRVSNPAPAGDSNVVNLPVVAPGPKISASGTVSAASMQSGAIAPGQILVFFGSGLGPSTLTVASGGFATTLASTQVLFGATAAPLIYTQARQVAAIVPYSVAGTTTAVTVVFNGTASNAVTMNVAASVPALFTLNGAGTGAVAALNSDGTINGDSNPANRGSIVTLFGTGEGPTIPAGVDGQINAGPTFPLPVLPVAVTIGGQPGTVTYAGGAGGAVAGLLQINVRVPDNVTAGSNVPVTATLGTAPNLFSTPAGTTISVR
ncbi:MAG: hypothetical protein EXQ52_06505 [Bryobacterales bacterium]|nr:hypothetical protein [Bryobacterales bacterium]